MTHQRMLRCIAVASAILFLLTIDCPAQAVPVDKAQDQSCTVNAAGGSVWPSGNDGDNFNLGWGFQAGGGFAVTHPVEPRRGVQLFITANYMYAKLNATNKALAAAIAVDPSQLASAKAAHGSFSAVTLDPSMRYPLSIRTSLYLSGGFGWFRRGIGFSGANPANLLHSAPSSLDRLASNSGVFDLGGGVNRSLTHTGGLMLYGEVRVYHGAAVNSSTTLVPVTVGLRW
jgi:hypothetical protein